MRFFDVKSINHTVLWFIVGLFFPNRWDMFIVLSLSWELFEKLLVHQPDFYRLMKKYWIIPEEYWNEPIENSITDIACNAVGYHLGSTIPRTREALYLAVFIFMLTVAVASSENSKKR